MTKEELGKKIYDVSHLTGSFLLRSGVTSNEYFDKYRFESIPELILEIAKQMTELLPQDFDYLAGLETGGIPLASVISLQCGKPVVFVRKKAKDYGTAKLAEGPDIKGKKLVVIEDVVTSGGQILLSVAELRAMGAEVSDVLCVIDRQSGGADNLAKENLRLIPLFTMNELKSLSE